MTSTDSFTVWSYIVNDMRVILYIIHKTDSIADALKFNNKTILHREG